MSTETLIKHSLAHHGANDGLASAVADAAADAGLNERQISYDTIGPGGDTIYVYPDVVPEAVHDRLTSMGFDVMDGYNPDSSDGMMGCKYKDTRYDD